MRDAADIPAAPPCDPAFITAANEPHLAASRAEQGMGVERPRHPCSLEQRRFWVLNQLHPGNPALHVAARWRLEGAVATAELEHAFREIIARHQILRSSFSESDGEPFQTIEPQVSFRIPEIDLSGLSAGEAEAEALRIAELEARSSFDLRSAPPFIRVTRLMLDEGASTLLVTAHHIVCDATSLGLIATEMCEIVSARQAGRAPDLPRLPVSYGEFSTGQAEFLGGESLSVDTAFWKKTLTGLRHFEMPTDRPRPPVQTPNGRIVSIPLDRTVSAELTRLGRRHGCTLFVTTLTALLTLLHRYTGETDIGVGTQASIRDEAELESLIGLFVNTLVLRNDLSGDPDFETLLCRVRDAVNDAFQRRHMPLEHAISIVRPQRDLSRNPLFSINFVVPRALEGAGDYGSFRLTELPPISCGAMYDLSVFLVDRRDGWRISCEYNTDLFEAETVRRLLSCFGTLLRGIAADASRPISQLPVLDDAGRQALLVDWNATSAIYPKDVTTPQLFMDQARRTPDAPAVTCERTLSYRELDEASSRLAHELRQRGVGPGKIVGVMLNRSTDLVVALMATLKAGGAYAPIDPAHPPERIAYVASHSGLATLITRSTLCDRLVQCQAPVLLIDNDAAAIAAHPATPPELTAGPKDVAYVLYTSGSTGTPKGVQIGHRSLVNVLWASRREPGLKPKDIYLSVTTIAFDVATLDVFLPLIVGAHLVLATEDQAASPEDLMQLLSRTRATTMFATPVTWQFLIEAGWRSKAGFKAICGGEAISRRLAEGLLAGGGELWNIYGPTETTIWSSVLKIKSGNGAVPIGPPIANTQFYILDAHREPVPPGAPGELYIGGDGVGVGYLGRAELTAERFLPDTFRDVPDARIYRTGDIVRLRRDGSLDYLGRGDSQIKLRGFRIELGEIEAVLLAQPEVAETVVVVGQDAAGDKAIWAYAVPRRADAQTPSAFVSGLRRAMGRSLPRYMCPSAFVVLPALPRLPNGKIDRKSLPPPPPPAVTETSEAAVEELTATEAKLAAIWTSVLGVKNIGPSDNFFELGGHSLLASRVLARVKSDFGRALSLSSFFNAPTVQQFSGLLQHDSAREYDFRQVVKLQANGSLPPLLAINNTGVYYQLSKQLGPEQPFTSLQLFDPSLRSAKMPETFEEIAAGYVQLIRRVQPHGPYALLGWCVAGTLAYEIACQLRKMGQEVSQLVMIDTYVPAYFKRMPRVRAFLADLSFRFKLIALDWSKVLAGQKSLGAFLADRTIVKKLLGKTAPAAEGSLRGVDERDENYDEWLVNYLQDRSEAYAPQRYDGKVTLFRSAEEPHGRFLDLDMGWSAFASGVEVVVIEGDHFSIFRDPGVSRMAQHISRHKNGNQPKTAH